MTQAKLTLGPVLFHWPVEQLLDFYARIADESSIDIVYLGEVVCSKRAPFFEDRLVEVAERLERGGKQVVLSSLAEVMLPRERKTIAEFCETRDREIEINDGAALYHISGRPHRIGPFFNVYNEDTLAYLLGRGATHVCLPAELPASAVRILSEWAKERGVGIEMQVFGRISLAVSARCYHARAHRRTKDNCLFVCEKDPDGMPLRTLDGRSFLAVNGIQTLSWGYLNLLNESRTMLEMGVGNLRLSPHTGDMVATSAVFRDVTEGRLDPGEGLSVLRNLHPGADFVNGFWRGRAGFTFDASVASA